MASPTQRVDGIDLTPSSGQLSRAYSFAYDLNMTTGDANATITNLTFVVDNSANRARSYQVTSGSVGTLAYEFIFGKIPGNPGATLEKVTVVSHSHDFGTGHAYAQFTTDLQATPTTYFDTAVDGNGILTDVLEGPEVAGASKLRLTYTADLQGGHKSLQQLLGVHIGATQSWTFSVTAQYADAVIPEPSTLALLALGGLAGHRRRRR